MRVLRRSRKRLISIFLRRCLKLPLRTLAAFKTAVLSVFSALTRALRMLAAFKAAVHAALRAVTASVLADAVNGFADCRRFTLLTDGHGITFTTL